MARKVIQISAYDGGIDALCDDGSMWTRYRGRWEEMENVPQD